MKENLNEVVDEYKDSLFKIAFNICGNYQDAEDVLQDVFIGYFKTSKEFQNREHLRAWLIRVTINTAKNKCNNFFRRKIILFSNNEENREEIDENFSFETGELSHIFNAVMCLPIKYRIVIHLFYYEDYSVKEIANVLKISENNVKVRLSRGRQMLKESLKEEWEDE